MAARKLYTINCSGIPQIERGELIHPVTIEAQLPTSPPTIDEGGPVLTWQTVATATVAIDTLRGLDQVKDGLTTSQLYLTIVMDYQPGILPNMRVVRGVGSSKYIIQAIQNVKERDMVLELTCLGLAANT